MRKLLKASLIAVSVTLAALMVLIAAKFGATAPPTRVDPREVAGRSMTASTMVGDVTLADLVYFGAAWQLLAKTAEEPPIILGGGYANARIERTDDGLFFAGTVERLDQAGRIVDVVLAFAGAQGVGDFIQGNALARGKVKAEPRWAAVLFERVWSNPRYAKAHIYVTGHSLGAGYAQFVVTEGIARHGLDAVSARVTVVAFGVPNWGPQAARYYHLAPHVLDGLFTGFTARNDPVRTNGGTDRVGRTYFMPPFDGLTGWASLANPLAAHWPTTYMSALGLPTWLTRAQKAASMKAVSDRFITGNSIDPTYRINGPVPRIDAGGTRAQTHAHAVAGRQP